MSAPLSRRGLNRALLARQHLLDRDAPDPLALIEHLGGVQAQEPWAPYVALWTRIADFDPESLSTLIAERNAVRAVLMRTTIHLVSAADSLSLLALTRPVLDRSFKGSQFAKQLGGAEVDELLAAATELFDSEPRTRAELASALGPRWPDAEPAALGHAACYGVPVVQIPPRGLWRQQGAARWTTPRAWLGSPPDPGASREDLMLRYLGAFGPATVKDAQAWSGLTRLREVADGLGDRIVRMEGEDGRELLDVPGAPLPDPETPAPPRLLAPFDNLILGHDDRSRVISKADRATVFRDRQMRAFTVDGFVAGTWRHTAEEIELQPLRRLSDAELGPLIEEAGNLLAFLEPGADPASVRIGAVPKN